MAERDPGVLLVHGIFNSARQMRPLLDAVEGAGLRGHAITLSAPWGGASIGELAAEVAEAIEALATERLSLDVVGFSMGALVSRFAIQNLGAHRRVRRFVSLSGPHEGTRSAHLWMGPAARDMRPGSTLLKKLHEERDPWKGVDVAAFYTPHDTMIVPASSSRLPGAYERTFPVLLHRWMITDPRVLRATVEFLKSAGGDTHGALLPPEGSLSEPLER